MTRRLIASAVFAHAGAGLALVIVLWAQLEPVLLASAHPAHALALARGMRTLLVALAAVPRVAALPLGVVAWRRATSADSRRWFAFGLVPLAVESVARALVALAAPAPVTVGEWVARLGPPAPAVFAAATLAATVGCWTAALATASAAARDAERADLWDRREAIALGIGTTAVAIVLSRRAAPVVLVALLKLLG